MSFISTQTGLPQDTARRWAILTGVTLLHAGAFYGLVVGLAGVVTFIDPPPRLKAQDDPFFVPVARSIEHPKLKPRVDTSRSVLDRTDTPVPQLTPLVLPSPDIGPIGDGMLGQGLGNLPPLLKSSARYDPRAANPHGKPGAWISPEDYPAQDLREGNSGTTSFRLTIGSDGRAQSCTIIISSGYPRLDAATCELVSRRAVFNPATDDTGAAITGNYQSKVYWTIPDR